MDDELHELVAARLRRAGQRYTTARRRLVDHLAAVRRPVTTNDIVRQDPNAVLSSVYRNLGVLTQAGAVRRVLGADDAARFELDEALTEHHHHLVCTDCGDVADFTLSPRAEAAVSRALADAVKESGFESDAHRLDVLGRCARCRATKD
ncbi:MAG: transcriptional repressor [Actinobacteria bacterium]|nr:transcriptional repressor [Actinomycetota bacterium]MBV9255159.1 transcriptional repressor [Actinomycetota bacterium]MBV9662678.1 transcriptional repressor [Actinomycetota bacterium]MBV9932864.1 transcriptional repressor [Actinomycetota bacterium]